MKKTISICSMLAIFLTLISFCFLFTGCNKHTCVPADNWIDNGNSHWRPCKEEGCETKFNEHKAAWSARKVLQEPTFTIDGMHQYTCRVCYQKKIVTVPKIAHQGDANITDISNLSKEYDAKPVSKPTFTKVGDANVVIKWFQGETELTSAPKEIGDYSCELSMPETQDFKPFSTRKDFSIRQREIKNSDLRLNYAQTNIYDLSNISTEFNVISGERVNLIITFENQNVGAKISALQIHGIDAGNYIIKTENINANIVKSQPTINLNAGILPNAFDLNYGEAYSFIMQANEKGERENGYNGMEGTNFSISPYALEEDISINYFEKDSTTPLPAPPLLAGEYYFEVQVRENDNYLHCSLIVPYVIHKIDLNVENLVLNKIWKQTNEATIKDTLLFSEENGIVYSDSVYLDYEYSGKNIGDTLISYSFKTEGVSSAYLNYNLVGEITGEIVGEVKIKNGTEFVSAFVKKQSSNLYADLECSEILTLTHLDSLIDENNQLTRLYYLNANSEEIEFASINLDQSITLIANLSSGGESENYFGYTNLLGEWIGQCTLLLENNTALEIQIETSLIE